jgi:hypothetical protein
MPMDAAGGYIAGAFTPEQREAIAKTVKHVAESVVAEAHEVVATTEHAVLHPIDTGKAVKDAVVHEAKDAFDTAKRGFSEILHFVDENPATLLL